MSEAQGSGNNWVWSTAAAACDYTANVCSHTWVGQQGGRDVCFIQDRPSKRIRLVLHERQRLAKGQQCSNLSTSSALTSSWLQPNATGLKSRCRWSSQQCPCSSFKWDIQTAEKMLFQNMVGKATYVKVFPENKGRRHFISNIQIPDCFLV